MSEQVSDATRRALPGYIRAARSGDSVAKQRLLEIFHACVSGRRPVYPALLRYLSQQIGIAMEASNGKNFATTLGKQLAGGPAHRANNPDIQIRDELIALEVSERMEKMRLADPGYTLEAAMRAVADKFDCGIETVKKARKKHLRADFLTTAPASQGK